jgi:hypothetical protein
MIYFSIARANERVHASRLTQCSFATTRSDQLALFTRFGVFDIGSFVIGPRHTLLEFDDTAAKTTHHAGEAMAKEQQNDYADD